MMKMLNIWFCFLMFTAVAGPQLPNDDYIESGSSQEVTCNPIDKSEYKIDSYLVPYSPGGNIQNADESSWIIEEYNVVYNLAQMPSEYEIPMELKTFAMHNKINGVEIVPDSENIYNSDIAVLQKTTEDKIILIVSQGIADKPEKIVRRLMGIGIIQENQGKELHSLVQIDEIDQGVSAEIARTVQKGVDIITGEDIDPVIDYDKLILEEGGSFNEFFGQEQATIIIKGEGPFDIEFFGLQEVIPIDGDPPESLVLYVMFKNEETSYEHNLYFSENGILFSCI